MQSHTRIGKKHGFLEKLAGAFDKNIGREEFAVADFYDAMALRLGLVRMKIYVEQA